MRPIGILYEHPEWFRPLFAELDRRGVPYEPIHAETLTFDPGETTTPYPLVVNRMSPSAWRRGHGHAIFHALHYLAHLEDVGASVLNGYRAFSVEVSKARQLGLFARLGVRYPRARVINNPSQGPAAAEGLNFPVMVKPNVGGSGAGIRAFDSPEELTQAVAAEQLEMGPDHTALVQEYLPAEGEAIVRIEILGGELLYAIRLRLVPGTFNLCPADYCEVPGVADGRPSPWNSRPYGRGRREEAVTTRVGPGESDGEATQEDERVRPGPALSAWHPPWQRSWLWNQTRIDEGLLRPGGTPALGQ